MVNFANAKELFPGAYNGKERWKRAKQMVIFIVPAKSQAGKQQRG